MTLEPRDEKKKKKKRVITEHQIFKFLINELKEEFPQLKVEKLVQKPVFWKTDKYPAVDSILIDPLSDFELKVHLPTGKIKSRKFISYTGHSEFRRVRKIFDLQDYVDDIRIILYDLRGKHEDKEAEQSKEQKLIDKIKKRFEKRHPDSLIKISLNYDHTRASVICIYENVELLYEILDINKKKVLMDKCTVNFRTQKDMFKLSDFRLKDFKVQVNNAEIIRPPIREGDKQIP